MFRCFGAIRFVVLTWIRRRCAVWPACSTRTVTWQPSKRPRTFAFWWRIWRCRAMSGIRSTLHFTLNCSWSFDFLVTYSWCLYCTSFLETLAVIKLSSNLELFSIFSVEEMRMHVNWTYVCVLCCFPVFRDFGSLISTCYFSLKTFVYNELTDGMATMIAFYPAKLIITDNPIDQSINRSINPMQSNPGKLIITDNPIDQSINQSI